MKKHKIAVLSVSAGAGHIRAAEAIRVTGEKYFPEAEIIHIDVMSMVNKLFKKIYAESYISVVNKHPALWGYFYEKADKEKADAVINKFRREIEKYNTKKFLSYLEELNPDQIICTHFLPAELLSYMIKDENYSRPVWVQVTDFDIHSIWIQENMTGYFAASEEVAYRMKSRGIPENIIHVTGIPVMPVFGEKYSRKECAHEIGINPNKTTLLMMSGGFGVGEIDLLAAQILKINGDFQMIALAGKNEDLLNKLQNLSKQFPERLFPMGFTKTIERLMTSADFAITKPGGLTSSECLAMGLPMIIISPIPGQEERNADYLLENGTALKAYDAAGLVFRVNALLQNKKRVEEMRQKALSIGKPDAARKVLEIVLGRK